LKLLSISSIGTYASTARYFVIVCPSAVHSGSALEVGPETYQRRGWCRLEQWARMTVGGLQDMYVFDGSLQPLSDRMTWYSESIRVMDGDFTDPKDRYKLVDTILGLWWLAISHRGEADNSAIFDLVQQQKKEVFPQEYFGDLVEMMEEDIFGKTDQDLSMSGRKSRKSGLFALFESTSASSFRAEDSRVGKLPSVASVWRIPRPDSEFFETATIINVDQDENLQEQGQDDSDEDRTSNFSI